MSVEKCPICELEAQSTTHQDYDNQTICDCKRCGKFLIYELAKGLINEENRSKLSGWLREQSLYDRDCPNLDRSYLERVIGELPDYTPLEKQNKLLNAIGKMTSYPGENLPILINHNLSLAWSKNRTEFEYYLNALKDRGFLNRVSNTIHRNFLQITVSGWEHIEMCDVDIESRSQVFIAMSFSEKLDKIYINAIKPAVEESGYTPCRVDQIPHIDRIDAKIITEIKKSRFLVADVTEQKAGVYYEAGFASGLGIPVIWCVHKNDLDDVHFDTRQYNHIVWGTEDQLKEDLINIISATIGKRSSKRKVK